MARPMLLLALALLALAPPPCTGKVTQGNFKLNGDAPEKYIAKFSFGLGEGRVIGNFHTDG